MKHYETLITHIRQLQNAAIHSIIMQDVDDFNKKIWRSSIHSHGVK